ncbi:PadR family transcriptional regulator [bacterium 210820-DFI.6.52]|nr:PadR family transcriptional regulator [bacterium 210820-DFI.6.52]
MGKDDLLGSLEQELRRGTLVLCTLGLLRRPMYGYHLVSTLAQKGIPVEAGTLYPLLRRLEGQGLLRSVWETDGAKPRKYYSLTPEGAVVYRQLQEQWKQLSHSVEEIEKEAKNDL